MIKRLSYKYQWVTPFNIFNTKIPGCAVTMPFLISTYKVMSKTNCQVSIEVVFKTGISFDKSYAINKFFDAAFIKYKHVEFFFKYRHHSFKETFERILKENNDNILDDTAINQVVLYFSDMEFKQHSMTKYQGSVYIGGV